MKKAQEVQDEEWYTWWARFEHGMRRSSMVHLTITATLLIMVVVQEFQSQAKDLTIKELSSNRTMIGFQNDKGVFVSSKTIPETFVARYARAFVNNFFVYGPEGVVENMNEARRMMDTRLAVHYHDVFQKTIDIARRDYLNQTLGITDYAITTTAEGFVVRFRGLLKQFAGQTLLTERRAVVTVRIQRVPITQATPEGMLVVGVTDKEAFEEPKPTAATSNTTAHAAIVR